MDPRNKDRVPVLLDWHVHVCPRGPVVNQQVQEAPLALSYYASPCIGIEGQDTLLSADVEKKVSTQELVPGSDARCTALLPEFTCSAESTHFGVPFRRSARGPRPFKCWILDQRHVRVQHPWIRGSRKKEILKRERERDVVV